MELILCKNCGEPVVFVDETWLHREDGGIFCKTSVAQPLEVS